MTCEELETGIYKPASGRPPMRTAGDWRVVVVRLPRACRAWNSGLARPAAAGDRGDHARRDGGQGVGGGLGHWNRGKGQVFW